MALDRIRMNLFARRIGILFRGKPPSFIAHVPVDGSIRDDGLETFELAHDQGAMSPWTGVADLWKGIELAFAGKGAAAVAG